nr:glycoside hydrolase family 2 TIM barrel-domain containing protein [Demequina litorisediminis]
MGQRRRGGLQRGQYAPAEFDVTDAVVPGANVVAVRVHRWSDGSWLENQDQIDLSGIFRDVELYSTPSTYLDDHTVTTEVADGGATATVTFAAEVAGASAAGATLTATLYDPDGVEVVSTTTSGATPTGVLEVRSPSLWTAETPSLYSLVYELADADGTVTETLGTRVGIREFAIVDGVMTLNGRPLDIKGVNRGEMHPDVGQAMTEEIMRADLTAMKRANITAVRTSHYPAHPLLYALADEIGLYVMDEANVESHDQRPFPGDSPAWSAAVLDRVTSMYERDKNHASVLWWSLGNEAGSGQVFQDAADWLRDADPTRLVHYQDDSSVADIDGVFYPSVSDVRERAEQTTGRPWIMTEYQMVMGNAVAGMTEYWDAIDSNPEMQGGFIWDWADQAIRVPLDGGFAALPLGETADVDTYLSYGGDWGDGATDGGFSLNGLVNPDRVAQPSLRPSPPCMPRSRWMWPMPRSARLASATRTLSPTWTSTR